MQERFVQSSKESEEILTTETGISMLARLLQPLKAPANTSVTVSGRVTFVRLLQFANRQ